MKIIDIFEDIDDRFDRRSNVTKDENTPDLFYKDESKTIEDHIQLRNNRKPGTLDDFIQYVYYRQSYEGDDSPYEYYNTEIMSGVKSNVIIAIGKKHIIKVFKDGDTTVLLGKDASRSNLHTYTIVGPIVTEIVKGNLLIRPANPKKLSIKERFLHSDSGVINKYFSALMRPAKKHIIKLKIARTPVLEPYLKHSYGSVKFTKAQILNMANKPHKLKKYIKAQYRNSGDYADGF